MPFLTCLRRTSFVTWAWLLSVAWRYFLAACGRDYPDSIFHQRTDVNRDVDFLFKILIYAGTVKTIFVEGLPLWTFDEIPKRPGQVRAEARSRQHDAEITWTVIPLIILVIIGIPTVQTIWKTEGQAGGTALQVEVIGHQWWWSSAIRSTASRRRTSCICQFTARRISSSTQRTSSTPSVPALAGKRIVSNHTNYIWWTPDSAGTNAWNVACVEYCGTSHANMRFKTFTVSPADFESWAKHQAEAAVGTAAPTPAPTATADTSKGKTAAAQVAVAPALR